MAAFVIPMVAPIMASHSLFLRGLLHSGIYFFVFLGLDATQPELRVWFNDRFFLPAGILTGEANAILLAGPSLAGSGIDAASLRTAMESQTSQPRPSVPSALWWTLLPTAPIFWALAVAGLIAVGYCGQLYAGRRKTT